MAVSVLLLLIPQMVNQPGKREGLAKESNAAANDVTGVPEPAI